MKKRVAAAVSVVLARVAHPVAIGLLGAIGLIGLIGLAGVARPDVAVAQAPPCIITWTGGAGTNSWHTTGNWDLNRVPGTTDSVCIPDVAPNVTVTHSTGTTTIASLTSQEALAVTAGTLSIMDTAQPSTLSALTLSGGALGGSGAVTVTGSMAWTGGQLQGAGSLTVAAGATLDIGGAGTKFLIQRTLVTAGATTWSAGGVTASTGATWRNAGVLDVQGDRGFANGGGAVPGFENTTTGTIRIDIRGTVRGTEFDHL